MTYLQYKYVTKSLCSMDCKLILIVLILFSFLDTVGQKAESPTEDQVAVDYLFSNSKNSFRNPLEIAHFNLEEDIRLEQITFFKTVNFIYDIFGKGTEFNNVKFEGPVSFNKSTLGISFSLKGSSFKFVPTFDLVLLPKYLDFEKVSFEFINPFDINAKIDFRRTYLNRDIINKGFSTAAPYDVKNKYNKCLINLRGTDASRFLLPYENFTIETRYNSYEGLTSIYEGLIKACKEEGMTESAQKWEIEYKKLQINHDWPKLGGFIIVFNTVWWNFGYEKWRILLKWLPILFTFFFLINTLCIKWLYNKVYQDNEIGKVFSEKQNVKPMLNKLSYRISYTLFYTAVIYFGLKLRHESVNYKNIWGLLYLYLMYIVGAIHVAFALSYILSAY